MTAAAVLEALAAEAPVAEEPAETIEGTNVRVAAKKGSQFGSR